MKQIAEPPMVIMPQPRLEIKDAEVVFLKRLWFTPHHNYRIDILNSFGYQKLFDISQPIKMIGMGHFRVLNDKSSANRTTRREWENKLLMASKYQDKYFNVKYNILGDFEVSLEDIKFTNSIVCFEPNR